jgi:glycosyltransferase involved in cell wall biosynthesis
MTPRDSRAILVLNERDPEHPLAGGAEVHIYEIFARMVERGWSVTHLAASFPGGAREATVRGVRVVRLTNRYLYYAAVPFAARRELRRRRYDVVVDVLNKLPFLSPWLLGRPCFAIVHHLFGTTAFKQVPFPIALVTYLSEKLIPHAYRDTRMLAISPSTKDDLVARGIAADHVAVVPPGLDHHAYCPGTRDSDHPIVLWVGRLEPYKRADVMLEAMRDIAKQVPAARLVIVGAGSARDALESQSRSLGVGEVVRFTGFVSEEEKIAWLRRAAVVVNSSEKEGWGMTVIEANACGVPAVSSDVPGLRDSTRHDVTGLLYPYGDAAALAAAVVRLLSDTATYGRMSAAALEWSARFTWDRVTDDAEALIGAAIESRRDMPRLVASPFETT